MKLKDTSVKLENISWRMFQAAIIAEGVFAQYGSDLVITSAFDGQHHEGSLHYKGLALDLRTWKVKGKEESIIAQMKKELGKDYDVVVEVDHIHLEYDPK